MLQRGRTFYAQRVVVEGMHRGSLLRGREREQATATTDVEKAEATQSRRKDNLQGPGSSSNPIIRDVEAAPVAAEAESRALIHDS